MTSQQAIPKNSFKATLAIFSGEDKDYVRGSEKPAPLIFACIGLFVILIFVGCLLSAYFFFDSLLSGNTAISVPIGIFWGLLVVNMYLLLLYTVSPVILPNKKNKSGGNGGLFTFSMFTRVGFMSLLAIITAQPLNVELFSEAVEPSIRLAVQTERARMIVSSDRFLVADEVKELENLKRQLLLHGNALRQSDEITLATYRKIAEDSVFLKRSEAMLTQLDKFDAAHFLSKKKRAQQLKLISKLDDLISDEISSDTQIHAFLANASVEGEAMRDFNAKLSSALASKLKNYDDLDLLLSKSNFYIKRVQLIFYECPLSFLSTSFVCFLFILPIVLKYQVRKLSGYYNRKIKDEVANVVARYEDFKIRYSQVLTKNVERFKFSSQERLKAELEKLGQVNFERYLELRKSMADEYQAEVFSKYEFWKDNPFRTMPDVPQEVTAQPPVALMDFLYNNPDDMKTLWTDKS